MVGLFAVVIATILTGLVGARIPRVVFDVNDDGSWFGSIDPLPITLLSGTTGACRSGSVDADIFVYPIWAQVGVAVAGASARDGASSMGGGILHHGSVRF